MTSVTTNCFCWRISPSNGQSLGGTDHDQPLEFEGLIFAPQNAYDAHQIERSKGLKGDNTAIVGAISSEYIKEEDIISGLYDSAEVTIWQVNWQNSADRSIVFEGYLGDIQCRDGVFEAEIRGLTTPLDQHTGRSYVRNCQHHFGDEQCQVNAENYQFEAFVKTIENEIMTLEVESNGVPIERLKYHSEWVEFERVSQKETELILRLLTPIGVKAGEKLMAYGGCDKSLECCSSCFDNALNFGGFPHIPGNDILQKYPVIGAQVSDGGK